MLIQERKGEIQMRFSGTSNNGDFQEALGLAIKAAEDELGKGGADFRITWYLLLVGGVRGGIIGQNDLTVEIAACSDASK
jgi:hypothetical protein